MAQASMELTGENCASEPLPPVPPGPKPRPMCLHCRKKQARKGSCMCSEKCKEAWKRSMEAWCARLKPVESGAKPLF
jgi:hypothetical protein